LFVSCFVGFVLSLVVISACSGHLSACNIERDQEKQHAGSLTVLCCWLLYGTLIVYIIIILRSWCKTPSAAQNILPTGTQRTKEIDMLVPTYFVNDACTTGKVFMNRAKKMLGASLLAELLRIGASVHALGSQLRCLSLHGI